MAFVSCVGEVYIGASGEVLASKPVTSGGRSPSPRLSRSPNPRLSRNPIRILIN